MNALWSSEQHAWLKVLGHTVYVQGQALPEGAAQVVAPVRSRESVPATQTTAPTRAGAAAPPAPPPRRAPAEAATAPAARTAEIPSARASTRLPDRLHFALIRASGFNPNAQEAAAVMAQWPPSSELRGNAKAKRALWPSLRRLRKFPVP